MSQSHYGLLLAILSPFLTSISAVLKTGAAKTLGPLVVLSVGALLGTVILFFFIILKKAKFDLEIIKKHKNDLILLILSRSILGELLFTYGLSLTTSIKAIFFTKVEAYFVLFWFWILAREAIKKRHLLLLFIHIIGAIILSTGGRFKGIAEAQIGDLLIILAMGFFSYSYFPATKVSKAIGAVQTNIISLTTAGIFFLPFAIFLSPHLILKPSVGWVYLLGHTVLFTSVGLTFWLVSLKTVKGWMVSALRALGPLVGAPFAYFLFGDKLNPTQILGGAIVLTTSFLIALEHLRSSKT